ncbi:MAG: diaminopimelate epimerase [Myxococcota bacterium]
MAPSRRDTYERPVRFAKYEGLGNDFIVVDTREAEDAGLTPADASRVRALCDRHTGIGADGVLFVDRAAPGMLVRNADGSAAEMCGNGLRCVARFLGASGDALTIATDAGPHEVTLAPGGLDVEVAMAVPQLAAEALPLDHDGPLVGGAFPLGERTLEATAVSMGNPHLVTFDDVGDARFTLGPALGADPRFPEGVNVGFGRMGQGAMTLHVFERGSGWTRACGTGACAAAVAAVETGRWERGRPLPVDLPGGRLTLTVGARDQPVRMRGPARRVFAGDVELADFA